MALEYFAPAIAAGAAAYRRRPQLLQEAIDNELRRIAAEENIAGARAERARVERLTPFQVSAAEAEAERARLSLDPDYIQKVERARVYGGGAGQEEANRLAYQPNVGTAVQGARLNEEAARIAAQLGISIKAAERMIENANVSGLGAATNTLIPGGIEAIVPGIKEKEEEEKKDRATAQAAAQAAASAAAAQAAAAWASLVPTNEAREIIALGNQLRDLGVSADDPRAKEYLARYRRFIETMGVTPMAHLAGNKGRPPTSSSSAAPTGSSNPYLPTTPVPPLSANVGSPTPPTTPRPSGALTPPAAPPATPPTGVPRSSLLPPPPTTAAAGLSPAPAPEEFLPAAVLAALEDADRATAYAARLFYAATTPGPRQAAAQAEITALGRIADDPSDPRQDEALAIVAAMPRARRIVEGAAPPPAPPAAPAAAGTTARPTPGRPGPARGAPVGTTARPMPGRPSEVKAGDTLAKIAAAAYGDAGAWRRIAEANGITDPRRLRAGVTIQIPGGR